MGYFCGLCNRCHGTMKVVTGLLLLLNAFVWPQWLDLTGWIAWVAVLMVVGGLVKAFVPNKCANCAAVCGVLAGKGKGKK